jgi:hypothetical protein
MLVNTREKLHQQIDNLPDSIVELIDKFTQILIAKQETSEYYDWESGQWQEFSLAKFFSEDDEIEYFLEDAREVYKP